MVILVSNICSIISDINSKCSIVLVNCNAEMLVLLLLLLVLLFDDLNYFVNFFLTGTCSGIDVALELVLMVLLVMEQAQVSLIF